MELVYGAAILDDVVVRAEEVLARVRLPLLETHVRDAHDERRDGDKECHCRFFSLTYIRLAAREYDGAIAISCH
ncbi:hypothetical protein TM239_11320 [Bradyrhizobium sp. TM239]|nr:hypothetical protein TM239_11320 [Bradyrhizobium sp. TM239]